MSVSILMATYNGEKFIEKQLDSIRQQTQSVDEVLICDDCSTDNTVKKISKYIEHYKLYHWKLVKNSGNLGHYQTFLKLCQLSSGKYLFFSDQDDIWESNKIEMMLSTLVQPSVSMVYCKSNFIDDNDKIIKHVEVAHCIEKKCISDMLVSWPSGYQIGIVSTFIKDVLAFQYEQLPGYDYHDVLFGQLACLYGEVYQIDEILDYHRLHLNNATLSIQSRSFMHSLEERITYLEKVLRRYRSVLSVAEQKCANEEVRECVKGFVTNTQLRIKFLNKPNVFNLTQLKKIKYIPRKDILGDIIYAYRLDRVASKLKKIGKK